MENMEEKNLEEEVVGNNNGIENKETKVLTVEEELKQQLEQKNKESEENWSKYLRVSADFDNFRKRSRQEKDDLLKYANQSIIEGFLPIIDNFERALASIDQQAPEVKQTLSGVEMIYRQIIQSLEQAGLSKINAEGQEFDPQLHEAVMQEETTDFSDNTIIQDLRTGYILKDKVIRPSMVKVAKNN